MTLAPRRLVLPLLLVFGCSGSSGTEEGAGGGASKGSKPAASAGAAESSPANAAAEEGGEQADKGSACRSYNGLDVATLEPLPEGDYVEVLDQVWRRVLEKYYDPTMGCLDWPALRAEFAAKVAAAPDRVAAYRLVNEMLGKLEQSHFHLFEPGYDRDESPGPAAAKVTVRYIDETLLVVDSDDAAVGPGEALLAVDGRSATEIVERAQERSSRPAELAFHAARGAEAWLSCSRPGESHVATFEKPGGASHDATLECHRREGTLVTLGNLENVPTRVEHRMLPGGRIGYLAFNVWMLPMMQRIQASLAELESAGMTALVLDLRGNPGGVGPMSMPMGRLLLQEKASLGRLQYRKFTQEFNVEPNADSFAGPIAILVDEGTASTSEIFAAGMHDIGRVTIVGGGPSAGAALPSVIEELEGGAILQYVVGDYHSPKGTLIEGKGVTPDVEVDEAREAFAAGRDPVLEAAVAHLESEAGKN